MREDNKHTTVGRSAAMAEIHAVRSLAVRSLAAGNVPIHLGTLNERMARRLAPVEGEILQPDGTVPAYQPPPRQRIHRDDQAEIIAPAVELGDVDRRDHQPRLQAAIAKRRTAQFADRCSVTLSVAALVGIGVSFAATFAEYSSGPVAERRILSLTVEPAADAPKVFSARLEAMPQLVLAPRPATPGSDSRPDGRSFFSLLAATAAPLPAASAKSAVNMDNATARTAAIEALEPRRSSLMLAAHAVAEQPIGVVQPILLSPIVAAERPARGLATGHHMTPSPSQTVRIGVETVLSATQGIQPVVPPNLSGRDKAGPAEAARKNTAPATSSASVKRAQLELSPRLALGALPAPALRPAPAAVPSRIIPDDWSQSAFRPAR